MSVRRGTRVGCAGLLALGSLWSCSGDGRDYERTPDAAIVREAKVLSDSGIVLVGTFAKPDDAPGARWPVVLLLSGSGAQDRDGSRVELPGYAPFRDIADSLVRDGIAVLRLDDRGTGASGGRFAGATTFDFATDAAAALRWLRAQPDVDARNIALVGHSEGALVAMLAASADDSVAALVLLGAAARTGRELARWQRTAVVTGDGAAFPPGERAGVLARAEHEAEQAASRDRWLRVWFDLDPRVVATKVRAPTLLLHGANDRQVPASDAESLAVALRAGRAREVEVHRFPSTNHLFLVDADGDPRGYVRLSERRVRADATRSITDFLSRVLR